MIVCDVVHVSLIYMSFAALHLSWQSYISRFQWDQAKFPLRQPLPNLVDNISKMVSQLDTDLKQKSLAFNTLRGNLHAIERKAT